MDATQLQEVLDAQAEKHDNAMSQLGKIIADALTASKTQDEAVRKEADARHQAEMKHSRSVLTRPTRPY